MLGIGEFFKKIQNAHTKELFIRTTVCDAIRRQAGIEVPIEAISFSGKGVSLKNVSQALRSAVFIKKQKILEDINSSQQARIINDIR